jgi:hypothetical protein
MKGVMANKIKKGNASPFPSSRSAAAARAVLSWKNNTIQYRTQHGITTMVDGAVCKPVS